MNDAGVSVLTRARRNPYGLAMKDTEWMTAGEAARYMGVAVGTIKRYRKRGLIKYKRLPGGAYRYHPKDLDDATIERVRQHGA